MVGLGENSRVVAGCDNCMSGPSLSMPKRSCLKTREAMALVIATFVGLNIGRINGGKEGAVRLIDVRIFMQTVGL